jgi:hypothetical protein
MTDNEPKPRVRHDAMLNTACCSECKAIKLISHGYREDGSKAKIKDDGPFFCSRRCAYSYHKKRETPDWVRK